jgi:predicted RNA-binding Zn ribbon-like protein
VTGQVHFISDAPAEIEDIGLQTAISLANALSVAIPADAEAEVRRVLQVDPPSLARLTRADIAPMVDLARRVDEICTRLADGDVDDAAQRINVMLGEHSAHPHLAHEDGRWRLHHHPADVAVVPMWTAICADALARLIDADRHDRVGRCEAEDCARAYLDTSKNGSRRFCSITCQNRVKAAAYRRRRASSS